MDQTENSTYWYVYLLRCNDNSIYTGCTSNINGRISRHKKGQVTYTSSRLPVKLITCLAFSNKYKAYDFERYLKSGSGKAFSAKRLVC